MMKSLREPRVPSSQLWLSALALTGTASAQVDYSQYVNPFIGGMGPFDGLACKFSACTLITSISILIPIPYVLWREKKTEKPNLY